MRYYFQNYFHDDSNNLAPRFGFAYAPTKRGRTVIRGGAGVFYDRTGPSPIGDLLHFNGVNLLRFIVNNPVIQNPSNPTPPPIHVPTSVVSTGPESGDSILGAIQRRSGAPSDGEEHPQRNLRGITKH